MFGNFETRKADSVTAGLPSLTPGKRSRIDRTRNTRAVTDRLVAEQEVRDRQALVIDAKDDATNLIARLGRPLHANTFISKVRKLNPALIFERSLRYPRLTGIYLEIPITELEKALGSESKRHICGMESEWMPEFSQSHYKTDSVPDMANPGNMIQKKVFIGETRGWRTVLMRLIRERLISPAKANKAFNIPVGQQSYNWQQLVN